jgi:MOSC domain-containing protein YiiM
MTHRTTEELDAGLDHIRAAPADAGAVVLIVRRPAIGEREVLDVAELSLAEGVVGDTWQHRGSRQTEDGGPHPDMQLNLINARAIAHISPDPDRRALAGDQLHVDLDLSAANLPPGTRLALGTAVIEVTAQPHNGCAKFSERFGIDAVRWVNSPEGKRLHLRGINAKVVQAGTVRPGDTVRKVASAGVP